MLTILQNTQLATKTGVHFPYNAPQILIIYRYNFNPEERRTFLPICVCIFPNLHGRVSTNFAFVMQYSRPWKLQQTITNHWLDTSLGKKYVNILWWK